MYIKLHFPVGYERILKYSKNNLSIRVKKQFIFIDTTQPNSFYN